MDIFSVTGIGFLLYLVSYAVILMIADCDAQLFFATIFGRRKLAKFKDKVIWITGASSGIGEHIARLAAHYGAKLILTARNEAELERVKRLCIEEGKVSEDDVLVLPLDITDISKHQSAFDKVIQRFGHLDILVNNAGRSQRATWENIDVQVDRDMFELNVFSNVSLSRLVAKHFLQRNEGHLAVTSSIAGVLTTPFSPTYCGTKFALHGYYGSFFKEKVESNVGVTLLCPGPVVSNLLPACFTDKPGEKFGESHTANDSRMTGERCAYLSLIAIANDLQEVWMAKFPVILLTYFSVYCPNISLWMYKRIGNRAMQRLRDQRETVRNS
ncbi:hypothetical protein V9T40_001598 [Parthenolecanium corni]|uniref:Dehydrogenase/reductase SDR family member 7 n=1 Tax=Parthenolecanium corni TaxID=536013 RepID=A0AAN9TIB7_9HEMI